MTDLGHLAAGLAAHLDAVDGAAAGAAGVLGAGIGVKLALRWWRVVAPVAAVAAAGAAVALGGGR